MPVGPCTLCTLRLRARARMQPSHAPTLRTRPPCPPLAAYGEDPVLTSALTYAHIRALQFGSMTDTPTYTRLIATSKHFLAYHLESWAGDGQYRLSHSFNVTEADIQQTYFPPFRAALQANVTAVMCAYDGSNTSQPAWPHPAGKEPWGTPMCASTEMARLLRDPALAWEGYVISDEGSITFAGPGYHGWTSSLVDAAALCLNAGTDLALGGEYASTLAQAVQRKNVTFATIQQSLRRLLKAQFALGWFDSLAALRGNFSDPVPWNNVSAADIATPASRALARAVSAASLVLLKNHAGALPLSPAPGGGTAIALIGPAADFTRSATSSYIGNYAGCEAGPGGGVSGDPRCHVVSLREALTAAATAPSAPFALTYAPGCSINHVGNTSGFAAALAAAQGADYIIAAMGLDTCQESDCSEGEANDRGVAGGQYPAAGLDLGGEQLALLAALSAAYPSTPLIVVYFNGGPISSPWVHAHAAAILEAWYPGIEGGNAIVDVLLGSAIPAGRMPVTTVRGMQDLPPHTDFVLSTPPGRTHRYLTLPPLLPFGHGLSYVDFVYSGLAISPAVLAPTDASFTVHAQVTRAAAARFAALPADEVVQVYGASGAPATGAASPPLQQLLAFRRLRSIGDGETVQVDFSLPRSALLLMQPSGVMGVQAGNWTLTLGGGGPLNQAYGGGAVLTGYLLVQ